MSESAPFPDTTAINRALALGVRDALRKHALYGVPAVVWRDGKVVQVPAEELLAAPEFRALDDAPAAPPG